VEEVGLGVASQRSELPHSISGRRTRFSHFEEEEVKKNVAGPVCVTPGS